MQSSGTKLNRTGIILIITLAFSIQQLIFFLFRHFHAEDAYILYRYVRNFIHGNGLVYNIGEHIIALTSPLHALILSSISAITEKPEISNRVLLWLSMIFLSIRGIIFLKDSSEKQKLYAITVIVSPFMIFWSLGGLETVLLAMVILEFTRLAQMTEKDDKRNMLLYLLAATAFLLRYDSAIYTFSVLLILFLQKKIKADISMLPGILIVSAWLSFSMLYYQTILPTSFHIKTPSIAFGIAFNNGLYLLHFFVLSGIIALAPGKLSGIKFSPVLAGILAILAYGLTCATTHMFFAYRMILPYLPATALYLIAGIDTDKSYSKVRIALITSAHLFCIWWMLNICIDPRLPFVEADFSPRQRSIKQYHEFMTILDKGGRDILEHSKSHPLQRQMKVVTFAGGYLPWRLPDAYLYETLVSYRSECPAEKKLFQRFAAASDYIHIIFPLHGNPDTVLGHPLSYFQIVSSQNFALLDKEETIYVLWNPAPEALSLPTYVNGSCSSQNR
jgi:hypothetical protein